MLHAESNRNPEKQIEPFKLYDFTFWNDTAEKAAPFNSAGAAMLRLIELNLFPLFALDGPWIADLENQGKGSETPSRLCWATEDAILLAPHREDIDHWGGFLIAQRSAAGKTREFYSEKAESITLQIPKDAVPTNAFANATSSAILRIIKREN